MKTKDEIFHDVHVAVRKSKEKTPIGVQNILLQALIEVLVDIRDAFLIATNLAQAEDEEEQEDQEGGDHEAASEDRKD